MTQVKTQIWRGGLPGVTSAEHVPAATPRVDTPEIPPPALAVDPAAAKLQPSPLKSTRIMPVEELLGRPLAANLDGERTEDASGEAQTATPLFSERSSAPPTAQARGRASGMRALIASLLVGTLAIWLVPLLRGQPESQAAVARTQRSPGPAPSPPAAEAVPASHSTRHVAELAQPRSPEERARAPGRSEQRTAADALASGDYPRAAALYEELARRHPEQPAYAHAARALRQRTEPLR